MEVDDGTVRQPTSLKMTESPPTVSIPAQTVFKVYRIAIGAMIIAAQLLTRTEIPKHSVLSKARMF